MDANADMLANRIRKRVRHLRKWARREGVTCYRVYDRDIPEIPLAIDWYEGHVVVHAFVDLEAEETWPEWRRALEQELAPTGEVHVKRRERQRGAQQYQRLERSGERLQVREGGYRFWVNLRDFVDTGLYLDHRLTRAAVESEALGKRVLNLFCYTGAFTVYAAGGGAQSTVSVDMSNTYLAWAGDNLRLNGLRGELVREDALRYVRETSQRFDLIILDPPTFSASKRMTGTLDISRDHVELINRALGLLDSGGALYFSTNQRKFRLAEDELRGPAREVTRIPEDFRGHPHRCWRIERSG